VERTTKTQVITRRDERFNIKSGRRVGDHTGNIIRVASKEDVFNIHKDNLLSTSLSKLNNLTSGCNNDILKHIEEIIIVANKVKVMKGSQNNRQKCIDMWQWIVDHPYCDKNVWAWFHKNLAEEIANHLKCFACKEAGNCCSCCPIRWEGDGGCMNDNSSYAAWENDKSKENAQAVLKITKETWKMKNINCGWMQNEELSYGSLEELMNNYEYIGFEKDGGKYIMLTQGSNRGCAVTPTSQWCNSEDQKYVIGEYFVFDTDRELYGWMVS
jgi:hypothetical protein